MSATPILNGEAQVFNKALGLYVSTGRWCSDLMSCKTQRTHLAVSCHRRMARREQRTKLESIN